MKTVKFTYHHKTYRPGDVVDLDDREANIVVTAKRAAYVEKKASPAKKTTTATRAKASAKKAAAASETGASPST